MLKIRYHTSFKADYKRIIKRGYDSRKLEAVISLIMKGEKLPKEYKEHILKGGKYNTSQMSPASKAAGSISRHQRESIISR